MCSRDHKKIHQSWLRLRDVVEEFDIALFTGAGLSKRNKLSNWAELVACLSPHESEKIVLQLKEMGFSLPTQLSIAESTFLKNESSGKRYTEWSELVRVSLYQNFHMQLSQSGIDVELLRPMLDQGATANSEVDQYFRTTNPALHEIVQMCAIREKGVPRIVSLLTTNLDSLVQYCDRALHGSPRMLRTIESSSKSTDRYKVPLYHLHGYLLPFPNTKAKREAANKLILTEQDYIARTDQPHHWASTILHRALVESPVVFIGCSMDDELCRRALYRTREQRIDDASSESARREKEHRKPRHFAICRFRDEDTNRLIERSFELIDLNPLWVLDFEEDLLRRLSELKSQLSRAAK